MSNGSKILNWKQITTILGPGVDSIRCVQWFKDTKLKANHNIFFVYSRPACVVSNGSKILNWKQITTAGRPLSAVPGCVQWFKDTKLKANHNFPYLVFERFGVVSNGSKILNWKQITTDIPLANVKYGCVQWFKDTKLKANHNHRRMGISRSYVVSNGSKILNWKQITTICQAHQNTQKLCPMVQRY